MDKSVIPKKRNRRIYSTDKEEDSLRTSDVPDQHVTLGPSSRAHTPDSSSNTVSTPSGSSPQQKSTSGSTTQSLGILIEMVYDDQVESAWDTEQECNSDTSTPDFKCGRHGSKDRRGKITTQGHGRAEVTNQQAIRSIQREGIRFSLPVWLTGRKIKHSILILADAQLRYWPGNNKLCKVVFHNKWPIKRWNQALRMGVIRVECHTVILYLEGTRKWQDCPLSRTACMDYARL